MTTSLHGVPGLEPTRAILTIDEVAAELRVSKTTVSRLLHEEQLSRLKVGSRTLITRVELDRFIDAGGTTAP